MVKASWQVPEMTVIAPISVRLSSASDKNSATSTPASNASRTTRATATAGRTISVVRRELIERVRTLGRSFAVKLIVLLVIFVSVPLILYGQFEAADDAKVRLLQQAVAQAGRTVRRRVPPQVEHIHL